MGLDGADKDDLSINNPGSGTTSESGTTLEQSVVI